MMPGDVGAAGQGIGQGPVFPDTRQMMFEHLLRGRVDEDAGDKTSACSHYAKILERWGHAKPRSVTAEEARSRLKALGCTQP